MEEKAGKHIEKGSEGIQKRMEKEGKIKGKSEARTRLVGKAKYLRKVRKGGEEYIKMESEGIEKGKEKIKMGWKENVEAW